MTALSSARTQQQGTSVTNQQGVLSKHPGQIDLVSRGLDVGLLFLSLMLAYECIDQEWTDRTTVVMLVGALAFEVFAAMLGLYSSQRSKTLGTQYRNVMLALLGTFAFLAISAYASNRFRTAIPREAFLWWLCFSALLLCSTRLVYRTALRILRKHGFNTRCAAIVGSGQLGLVLAQKLQENPWMGVRVSGLYDVSPPPLEGAHNMPWRGNIENLVYNARQGLYEHIYIALPLNQQETIKTLTDQLSDTAASVYFVPDIFVFDLMNARHNDISGIPVISIYDTPFSTTDAFLKRIFDIGFSMIALVMISPVMVATSLAIKLTSPGPVIFRQKRYGLDGKPIEVWKFRSMTTMDNGTTVKQATRNDTRITPMGAFLRRTSLDELPQFINVLQGSMSIVGPRPHAVAHNEEYRKLIKGYMLRHKVKPGITGWAQINGWRGETDTLDKMQKRVEYDLHYIRNWSVGLDIKIVLMTVFKGFTNKNAY